MRGLTKPFWIALALLFLFEEWFFTHASAALRAIGRALPLDALRRGLERLIAWLPAPLVLLLFAIPALALFPIKIAALWLFARGHLVTGVAMFGLAKVVGVGIGAFLFGLCREKLMTMPLFARSYALTLRGLDWAHELVAPLKEKARAALAAMRAAVLRALPQGAGEGRLMRRVRLLRQRAHRP